VKLFVDQLTNVDFSFLHPQRGLLGESWHASIELEGQLNEEGMLCDFGTVKKMIKKWLDTYIDHRLLLPTQMQQLKIESVAEQELEVTWQYPNAQGTFFCKSPEEGFALIDSETITEQSLARHCEQVLQRILPGDIERLSIRFDAFDTQGPFYHYSHGLKKHDGNCQRIAHGHRSLIKIWRNNNRAPDLEANWAQRWQDIYLGTEEDLNQELNLQGIPHHHYRYQARQGHFEIRLPAHRCYLIPTDTTVEWIAVHVAEQLAQECPGDLIRVQAYEGILKGAIAEALG
jgi:6-pyruvoyl-tetrahydropterin synthase